MEAKTSNKEIIIIEKVISDEMFDDDTIPERVRSWNED